MGEKAGSSHLWQAVGAGATALAAVVGLATYLWPNASPSSSTSVPTARLSTSVTTAQSPATAIGSSSVTISAAPQGTVVLAQAVVRMSDDSYSSLDIDAIPLTVGSGFAASFETTEGTIYAGTIAPWSGSGTPTPDQCADLLRTQKTIKLVNHAGLVFCTEGISDGHIGIGDVLSYDGSTSEIKVTVWAAELN